MLHDQVIGTFNVESPLPRAFTESDLQFLEIFCRDVAAALNTLELLAAEKLTTAVESVEAIHSAVALPVDEILNDAVNIMERYIGHEPEVVERLHRILRNARDIKQVIQKVGRKMAPGRGPAADDAGRRAAAASRAADSGGRRRRKRPRRRPHPAGTLRLRGRDGPRRQRGPVHGPRLIDGEYDVIIADIRLPDMTGYELMLKLQELVDVVPMVLMTGFGWDPGHSIVKARQAGLQAVLYKPFRLDQLLGAIEQIIHCPRPVAQG